jgi:hypothetical protein
MPQEPKFPYKCETIHKQLNSKFANDYNIEKHGVKRGTIRIK